MSWKHFTAINMNADNTMAVTQFEDDNESAGNKKGKVIVSWGTLGGVKDGTIELFLYYPSNDANTANHSPISAGSKIIDANDEGFEWVVDSSVEKFSLVYTKVGITTGTMKQSIYVRRVNE